MTKRGLKFAGRNTGYPSANEVTNGIRPHGGYRDSPTAGKYEHPLSFSSFHRNHDPELFAQLDNDFSDLLENRRDELRTPDYVFEYTKGVSYSDESPLFSNKLLAPSKMERDGHLNFSRELLRPTKCNPPVKGGTGQMYYRPNPTHQYLTATDLRDCTRKEVNVHLGRPTRTTLLRARQRCNSAPARRVTPRREEERPKSRDDIRPTSAIVPAPGICGMVNRVSTGGDTYGAYILGARYNRAHCIDSQTVTKYGTYISRENPANCFSLQRPEAEPEIEIPLIPTDPCLSSSPEGSPPSSSRQQKDARISLPKAPSPSPMSSSATNFTYPSTLLNKRDDLHTQSPKTAGRIPSRTINTIPRREVSKGKSRRGNYSARTAGAFQGGIKFSSSNFYPNSPRPHSLLQVAGTSFPNGCVSPSLTRHIVKGDRSPRHQKLTVRDISTKLKDENIALVANSSEPRMSDTKIGDNARGSSDINMTKEDDTLASKDGEERSFMKVETLNCEITTHEVVGNELTVENSPRFEDSVDEPSVIAGEGGTNQTKSSRTITEQSVNCDHNEKNVRFFVTEEDAKNNNAEGHHAEVTGEDTTNDEEGPLGNISTAQSVVVVSEKESSASLKQNNICAKSVDVSVGRDDLSDPIIIDVDLTAKLEHLSP